MGLSGLRFRKACIKWTTAQSSASYASGTTKPTILQEKVTGVLCPSAPMIVTFVAALACFLPLPNHLDLPSTASRTAWSLDWWDKQQYAAIERSIQSPIASSSACSCRKGKRSALVDHQTKNKEHKQLVQDMELGLKRVMLVGGVAQRLLGKVAIITGLPAPQNTSCSLLENVAGLQLMSASVPVPKGQLLSAEAAVLLQLMLHVCAQARQELEKKL